MRRLVLYLALILAACAPTVIAARAVSSSPPTSAPGAATRENPAGEPDEEVMIRLSVQGLLAVAIIVGGLVVGEQLRASRERLGTGQAGSAASVQPTTTV